MSTAQPGYWLFHCSVVDGEVEVGDLISESELK